MVIDSAPTGHALRLLEMPGLAHDWVKALMAILLKYQSVVGVGGLGEVLLRLSQGLRRLRALLTDPARTTFVAVTRPAALPHAETLRLVRRLRAASISVPAVVVNAMGAGTCTRCARESRVQQRELTMLARELDSRRDGPAVDRRARMDAGACGRRRVAPVCSAVAPAASRGFGSPALTGPAAPAALSSPQASWRPRPTSTVWCRALESRLRRVCRAAFPARRPRCRRS